MNRLHRILTIMVWTLAAHLQARIVWPEASGSILD